MATQEEARQAILDAIEKRAKGTINSEGVKHIAEAFALIQQPFGGNADAERWRENS